MSYRPRFRRRVRRTASASAAPPTAPATLGVLLAAALGPAGPVAAGEPLFVLTGTDGAQTVAVSGSNLLDLTEDAIEAQDAFATFDGSDFNASLRYAGVDNAVNFSINGDQTAATLRFPGTGFERTFTAADGDDLEDEIREFIETDGGAAFAEFLEDLNRRSVLAVTDGNPFSSTALVTESLFDAYGLNASGGRFGPDRPVGGYGATPRDPGSRDPAPGDDAPYVIDHHPGVGAHGTDAPDNTTRSGRERFWFALNPNYAEIEAGPFDGVSAGIALNSGVWFTDHVALSVGSSLRVNSFEDTESFHSSFNVALPIRPVDTGAFALQVTPFFVTGLGGSVDAAAGGAFFGYGGTLGASLMLGDRVRLDGGVQYVQFEDQDLEFEEFDFDTELDQSTLTAGGRVTLFLDGPDGHWFVDGGVTWVDYLEDAAVGDWLRPEVGVGWRWGVDSRMRFAYRGLIADGPDGEDVEADGITANIVLTF